MGFFRPANDDDQGGEPPEDGEDAVDEEVRDEAGDDPTGPAEEADPSL